MRLARSSCLDQKVVDPAIRSPTAEPTCRRIATVYTELSLKTSIVRYISDIEFAVVAVQPAIAAACEFLNLEPSYIANEGKLVAIYASHLCGLDAAVLLTVDDNTGYPCPALLSINRRPTPGSVAI
jgi:hypothetical protein